MQGSNGDQGSPITRELSVRKSVAEVRKAGWVYRESSYIDWIVNPRYGAIYPHALVTFRASTVDMPTKVWPLHPLCKLGFIQEASFLVRGRSSSMLLALATQHLKRTSLMYFTIDWPHNHIFGAEHLKLCFEDMETASEWHAELDRSIGELAVAPKPALGGSVHESSRLSRSLSRKQLGRIDSGAPFHSDSIDVGTEISKQASGGASTQQVPDFPYQGDPNDGEPPLVPQQNHRWASFRHVNGVAVFREEAEDDGEGGAMMVSTVVHAAPKAVWKALMDLDPSNHFMFPFFSACVLECKDENTRIVKGWLQSNGLAFSLCAPREAVLEQTWRLDEDGTYIVLMQSTEHAKAPQQPSSLLNWYRPVRAEVVACGYTIAPLQARYQGPGGSTECLVTMVLKLNPGGWLQPSGVFRKAMTSITGDRFHPLLNNYVEPLLLSVITLRDKVEQERFVVKPFSMGQQAAPEDDLEHGGTVTPPPGELERSTTQIMRKEAEAPRRLHRVSAFTPAPSFTAGTAAQMPLLPLAAEQDSGSVESTGEEDSAPCMGTLDCQYWNYPGSAGYKLRGPNYIHDKKKVPSEPPLFALNSADLVEADEKVWEIGRFLPSIKNNPAPFTFVLNLIIPGPPWRNLVMSWSADYNPAGSGSRCNTPKSSTAGSTDANSTTGGNAVDDSDSECEAMSPFDVSLARFLSGEGDAADKNCGNRFKLIPSVVKGSWVIKQAVGNTPVLLGNKLDTKYFRCDKYFEMDVDIGSSYAACSVVNLVKGATKSLVINFGVLVEGQADDELPERLIGTCQFANLDMTAGMYLDPEGKLHHKAEVSPSVRRFNSLQRGDSKLKVT